MRGASGRARAARTGSPSAAWGSIRRVAALAACTSGVLAVVCFEVLVRRMRPVDALARHLAAALCRLGTATIKIGQLIASSPGTFPAELVAACSGLRDHVAADGDFDLRALLRDELGTRCDRIQTVDAAPIAAASIAQVHVGRLTDGTKVAIKVQRPHAAATLATDLRLLRGIARVAERVAPSLRRVDLTGTIDSLSSRLLSELDFTSELRNAATMRDALAGTRISVPRCVGELCTSRVLVMEFLEGQPLSSYQPRERDAETARRVLEGLLAPLARGHVFHGDMHGGNLLVGPRGDLGMVDFGTIIELDDAAGERLVHALLALFERRFEEAAYGLIALTDVSGADLSSARAELVTVTSTLLDRPVEEIQLGVVLRQLMAIGTSHGIVMPVELLSLMRQMLFLDGMMRDFDPTFSFFDEGAAVLRAATGSQDRHPVVGRPCPPGPGRLAVAA